MGEKVSEATNDAPEEESLLDTPNAERNKDFVKQTDSIRHESIHLES